MLPFVQQFEVNGRLYSYYRRDGKRVAKLPDIDNVLEFVEAHKRIHERYEGRIGPQPHIAGSIASLRALYENSSEFKSLKPKVKKLYLPLLNLIEEKIGARIAVKLTEGFFRAWQDDLFEKPGMANNWLTVLKKLYAFGGERGITCVSHGGASIKVNPVAGIKKLKVGEWRPWTFEEIEQFKKSTSPEMLIGMALGLYTGQRRGDVVAMNWGHIENSGIHVKQEKTGKLLWIPMHRDLKPIIEKAPRSSVMILTSPHGVPYKERGFSDHFKEATKASGLPDDCVFHGLRKTACVMLAEAGCTEKEIQAITGQSLKMIEHYTKMANQKKLALSAMQKMESLTH